MADNCRTDSALHRKFATPEEAAREYIQRSQQKSRKTFLGYRTAVNLFVASCKNTYFDEICRDDMLDFLHDLRTRPSRETGKPIGESTVFNYFLKTIVFLRWAKAKKKRKPSGKI